MLPVLLVVIGSYQPEAYEAGELILLLILELAVCRRMQRPLVGELARPPSAIASGAIHAARRRTAVLKDLQGRDARWLDRAAAAVERAICRDFADFKRCAG